MKKIVTSFFVSLVAFTCLLFCSKPDTAEAAPYAPPSVICFYSNSGYNYLCPPTSSHPTGFAGGTNGYNAYAFADQFGANIHLSNTGVYNNYKFMLGLLQYMNIHHVRDGLSVVPGNTYMINVLNAFSANGIHVDLITSPGMSVSTISTDVGYLNPGVVDALEGPNELDINNYNGWAAADVAEIQNIRSYVNASNPGISVIGPSLGGPGSSYNQLGDLSQYVDYGNTHDYAAGFYPETPGYGGPGYCGYLYGGVDYNLCNAKQASQSKPVIATEFGYQNDANTQNDVDPGAQGPYLIRQVFKHQSVGIAKSYIYELISSGGQNYGIAQNGGYVFPSVTEIGGFMQIIKDNNPINGACAVPAAINTSGVSSFGICMSNGQYALVAWQPVTGWDTNAKAYVNVPTINAAVTYSAGFAPTSLTQWSYPLNGAYSNSGSISPNSVPITDRPSVIMMNGPVSPTPLPTPPVYSTASPGP